jgi:hypothetical protein
VLVEGKRVSSSLNLIEPMEDMMNSKTRTSLVVLITFMVLLAVAVPVQAKTQSNLLVEYTPSPEGCDDNDVANCFMYQWQVRAANGMMPPPP